MLDYVIKAHLHKLSGTLLDNGSEGKSGTTLTAPRPISGAISSLTLHPDEQSGREKAKLRTQKQGHLLQTHPSNVLGKPQAYCSGVKTIKVSQCWSTIWIESIDATWSRIIKFREREICFYTMLIMGCYGNYGEETKGGERQGPR